MKKLTAPQVAGLVYFRNLADKTRDPKVSYPDPRVLSTLLSLKYLTVVGYNYGPLHGITDAGRAAIP